MNNVYLTLSNNKSFSGQAFNFTGDEIFGEVVFNTGMTGYEETITDPSYAGQILVFTYPLLGNYGVGAASDWESEHIHVKAVICSSLVDITDDSKQNLSFVNWLKQQNIPILTKIDTRELTKMLRDNGSMNGIIHSQPDNNVNLNKPVFSLDMTKHVSTPTVKSYGNGKYKLLLVDFGVKQNIIRTLLNFDVTILQIPFDYDYSNEEYDGILLSNGPGDPKMYTPCIEIIKKVLARNKPIFGICLGAQLLGLAAGASTYKLKFGHRGQNQPCQEVATRYCYLTSQNHGYAIAHDTLPADWEVTFLHLHDNSIAGIQHKTKPYFAVQFHPEAAAGPNDTVFLFEDFIECVKNGANNYE